MGYCFNLRVQNQGDVLVICNAKRATHLDQSAIVRYLDAEMTFSLSSISTFFFVVVNRFSKYCTHSESLDETGSRIGQLE